MDTEPPLGHSRVKMISLVIGDKPRDVSYCMAYIREDSHTAPWTKLLMQYDADDDYL